MTLNLHAIYVRCDGSMDYNSKSTGGVGYEITFPDFVDLETIQNSIGKYQGANIERLELEALIQGMDEILGLIRRDRLKLRNVKTIIFITDRFNLNDQERTNAYKIRQWRSNNWHNYEGKPIKNSDLLEKLDKKRKKICDSLYCRIEINFKPRKQNKTADKLAKSGKKQPIKNESISIKSTKTSRRLFDGTIIDSKKLNEKENYLIHVYRKEPVKEQWEIIGEICEGKYIGTRVRIYADDVLSSKLQRQHMYRIRIKGVFNFHITIYRTITELKNKSIIINKKNE